MCSQPSNDIAVSWCWHVAFEKQLSLLLWAQNLPGPRSIFIIHIHLHGLSKTPNTMLNLTQKRESSVPLPSIPCISPQSSPDYPKNSTAYPTLALTLNILSPFFSYPHGNQLTAIITQATLTYGLNLSPTRAHFQNGPTR